MCSAVNFDEFRADYFCLALKFKHYFSYWHVVNTVVLKRYSTEERRVTIKCKEKFARYKIYFPDHLFSA